MRIEIDAESGCWVWQGALNANGYGQVGTFGDPIPAHRASYMLFVGMIPVDFHVHHTCRNRACVNPSHLEALPVVPHAKLTHPPKDRCVWGHPFDKANTYVRANGERQCRKCKARRERERQRRLRDAAGITPRAPAEQRAI